MCKARTYWYCRPSHLIYQHQIIKIKRLFPKLQNDPNAWRQISAPCGRKLHVPLTHDHFAARPTRVVVFKQKQKACHLSTKPIDIPPPHPVFCFKSGEWIISRKTITRWSRQTWTESEKRHTPSGGGGGEECEGDKSQKATITKTKFQLQ